MKSRQTSSNDIAEATMKLIYSPKTILKTFGIVRPCLLAMTTAFLLAPPLAFSATEFQGNLNSVSITDAAGTNVPPTATFTYTQEGDIFTFDASGSTDSDGSITGYKWNFGDGQFGEGASISHTIVKGLEYQITLTTIDNAGAVTIHQEKISSVQSQIIAEQLTGGGQTTNIRQTRTIAQGIYFPAEVSVSAITMKTTRGYGAPPVRIRISETLDASKNYIGESNEIIVTAPNTEYAFPFSTPVVLKANTQYYFLVAVVNDLTSNYFGFVRSALNEYKPDTCPNCNEYFGDLNKWNANKNKFTGDLYFKVHN